MTARVRLGGGLESLPIARPGARALHELVAHAEATTGIPWPFSRDRRPDVPDTVEGLQ